MSKIRFYMVIASSLVGAYANHFFTNWRDAAFDIANWTCKHPVEYLSVSIPLVVLSIWSGATFGDWSFLGAVKFVAGIYITYIPGFLLLTAFARRPRLS